MSFSHRFAWATLWWLIPALSILTGTAYGQRNLAVTAASAEQRVALIIGNSAYKESPLANPVNDATEMASALQDMGFKVILKRNAGTRDMRQAIRDFHAELRRAQVGLFYFAGHGVQVRGSNYLIPVGADIRNEADVEDLAIDATYALRMMEEAQVKVSIVILDACRNNPFGRGFRSASRGLAQMTAATGSLIAFATAPGSVAADGSGRNGIYTKHLLASLKQPDSDILKVFQRTRAAVVQETGGRQTPWESTSLVGDFHFRPPAGGAQLASVSPSPAAPLPTANLLAIELAFWDSIKASTNRADFEEYLRQYPDGRFAGLARNRLQPTGVGSTPPKSSTPSGTPPAQIASVAPAIAASRPSVSTGSIAAMPPGTVLKDCDACPEMVVIPAGRFTMGAAQKELKRERDEGPRRGVTIAAPFAVGKYEVTRAQFARFVQETGHNTDGGCRIWRGNQFSSHDLYYDWRNPAFDQTDNHPVTCINWSDAKAYVEWLSRKTGKNYRLLSEAQWEYAARAGTTTPFSFGLAITPQQANYETGVSYAGSPVATSTGKTVPVGSYAPNPFGLHDMHGNVWEWTEDCWNPNYEGAPVDGRAWTTGDCTQHVIRGGAWNNPPSSLRSANRGRAMNRVSAHGLRVARTD